VTGFVGSERKRKRAADSVQFRRAGRSAAETTPYVDINVDGAPPSVTEANATEASVPNTQTRQKRREKNKPVLCEPCSSSSESDNDDMYNYIPLRPGDSCSSNISLYMEKINNTFLDKDEDIRFRILSVCEGRKGGMRGGNNALLFYEYVEVDNPDGEVHYTQCRELLNSSWAKWDPTPAASSRAARLSTRKGM
jgi:hypothetical protein